MKSKLIGFFTKNTLLKLLSLGMAFVLWLVVVNYDDPTTSKTYSGVSVELTNTDIITEAGKVYEVDESELTVPVTVKAKRSVHNALGISDFKAIADLTRVQDDGTIPVEVKAVRYADRIDSISLKGRSSVNVVIEPLISKRLGIKVETVGELLDGYMVGSVTTDKNMVKITGPASKVDEVASARIKVDVSGMSTDISTSESVELLDEEENPVRFDNVITDPASVGIKVSMWEVRKVPVLYGTTGDPAAGFGLTGVNSITPAEVEIAGASSTVRGVNSIVIPSSQIDVSGAASDKVIKVKVEDFLPAGVVLSENEEDGLEAEVRIGVAKLSSKTVEVPVANITVENMPEGQNATVGGLGDLVAVDVLGLGESFEKLNPLLITGKIDVNALNIAGDDGKVLSGVYDAPVTFQYPEGVRDGGNHIVAQLIVGNAETDPASDGDTAADAEEGAAQESEQ